MVRVEPGTYRIGCPASERFSDGSWDGEREVSITRPFLIGRAPVTRAEWWEVMGNDPSRFDEGSLDCPVERVSWFDALYYLNQRSKRDGLAPAYRLSNFENEPGTGSDSAKTQFSIGRVEFLGFDAPGFRLPTEAEWEVAARAGCAEARYGKLGEVAWYSRNSENKTHPVGEKKPNAWGLVDVLGNVGEWVWDRWGIPPSRATDPLGPDDGLGNRMIRGHGWAFGPKEMRLAYRNGARPSFRIYHVGLRVVRSDTKSGA